MDINKLHELTQDLEQVVYIKDEYGLRLKDRPRGMKSEFWDMLVDCADSICTIVDREFINQQKQFLTS